MYRSWLRLLIALPAVGVLVLLVFGDDPGETATARLDTSVVRVFVQGPEGTISGTGFVVSSGGIVVTNFHVVQAHVERGWAMVVGPLGDDDNRRPAEVVQAFPGEDLGVLRVAGLDRPPVTFAAADAAMPASGLEVFAIGFPAAADRLGPQDQASLVRGAISRTFSGPWEPGAPTIQIIQHTAPINPGNSGGPLADPCGHVIGINTQREARVIYGPGGIPIVTDPIQGLFYASSAATVTQKLTSLSIAFHQAPGQCGTGILASLRRGPDGATAAGVVFLSIAGLGLLARPRAAVTVVVNCGNAVANCAHAIERALQRHSTRKNGTVEIAVTASPPTIERGTTIEHRPADAPAPIKPSAVGGSNDA